VAVRILEEELHCSIRPLLDWIIFDPQFPKMIHPSGEVVGAQGKVVPTVVRVDGLTPFADEMKLLTFSESKPGPGKRKGRPGNRLETKDIPVKRATAFHVLDVEGDMVQLQYVHDVKDGMEQRPVFD
jgi:hypothetical protein